MRQQSVQPQLVKRLHGRKEAVVEGEGLEAGVDVEQVTKQVANHGAVLFGEGVAVSEEEEWWSLH